MDALEIDISELEERATNIVLSAGRRGELKYVNQPRPDVTVN